MDKRTKNIFYLLGGLLAVILLVEVFRPQPVNWRDSYAAVDKIPLGTYVLHHELSDLLGQVDMQTVVESPYTFLKHGAVDETGGAYVFINNYLHFDEQESEVLLDYAANGNAVFLAARSFSGTLADTLNIATEWQWGFSEGEATAKLFAAGWEADSAVFKKGIYQSYFTHLDTLNVRALGHYTERPKFTHSVEPGVSELLEPKVKTERPDEAINFVTLPYGEGAFYLHSQPEAFSNYYMLNGNKQYVGRVFSYLSAESLYWDEYKKTGRRYVSSPMRYVLSQASLRWAYYILIGGLLLFVLFRGKREQRIVPVVTPLENTSVAFTRTIAGLYFEQRDYSDIIAKKIVYLLSHIRERYFLDTSRLDVDFCQKLATKSGRNPEEVHKLIQTLKQMKQKNLHTEQDLLLLSKAIEPFEEGLGK